MSVPYNPFEPLNLPLFKDLIRNKTCYLVVQRLQWPGIAEKKGFIATPYQQQKPAKEHAQTLSVSEGRLINLQSEMEKILGLIDSTKYLLYLNTFTDPDWEDKVLKYYQKNILSNLNLNETTKALKELGIEYSFRFGKLMVTIQTEESIKEFFLFELIK
ncbi:hypothetical protein [Dyadobacter sp. CY356]|uniref:hypothetical protein n=1 Tax=Dyadobacter sp. CY356 TaxID=2906442 RepID=UPI001F19DFF3|nr:hypothetical protein [Dyadobacter sp. CY356]MCF0059094.1 hypothetical protein [Dyadobacter sp. CY356]